MRVINFFIIFLVIIVLNGCATGNYLNKTSLELQAIQAREFEASKKVAFAAVFSVFQDYGYIIDSASIDTGFINAEGPTSTGMKGDILLHSETTKATAFIEELGEDRTKVRLNFVVKDIKTLFKIESVSIIDDPVVYQNAFTKIQEAIFIRSASGELN